MNIIFFSIFFRRRICPFYAEFGQLLRESGQFECWDGDEKRKGAWRIDGNEKGCSVVCVRDYCITLYFRGRKISRKVNLKYFREKIFSRIYCSREKISSRENIFSRKYPPAKISSRENILPRKSFACFVIVASFSMFAGR